MFSIISSFFDKNKTEFTPLNQIIIISNYNNDIIPIHTKSNLIVYNNDIIPIHTKSNYTQSNYIKSNFIIKNISWPPYNKYY